MNNKYIQNFISGASSYTLTLFNVEFINISIDISLKIVALFTNSIVFYFILKDKGIIKTKKNI